MERYSEYKDSGVQWLGEIPRHWKTMRLGLLGECSNGVSKGGDYFGEGYPFVSYSDVYKNIELPHKVEGLANSTDEDRQRYSVEYGDVFFTRTSETIQEIGFSSTCLKTIPNAVFAGFLIRFRPTTSALIPEYSKYYFRCNNLRSFYVTRMNLVTRASLSQSLLRQLNVTIPPVEEQYSIVSYLDEKCGKIDKMLEGKQKQIELLAEMKQRIIADAVTRGLNPEVKMKATNIPWLPEIPEHWEEQRMATLFTGDIEVNKDFEYKRAFKFNYGQLVPKNEIGEPEDYREVYVKYSKIKQGDILVNGLNLNYDFISQRVACAPSDGIITSAYVVCRPRKDVNYEYYTYLFKGMDSMKLFHGMGTGIRLTLSFKEMKKQILLIPPHSEQHDIVSYIKERSAKIDILTSKLQQEIESIKEYKQRLISDVVTGQIKVC